MATQTSTASVAAAPPVPVPSVGDPLVVAADGAPARPVVTAEIVPGLERVSAVSTTFAGLCALVEGKSPICVGGPGTTPAPRERLVRWSADGNIDCRLDDRGALRCSTPGGLVTGQSVRDMVITEHVIYLLLADRTVSMVDHGPKRVAVSERKAVFRDVEEIHPLADDAACARTSSGSILCTDPESPFGAPVRTLAGATRATRLVPGFFRGDDGTLFAFGAESARQGADPFVALRLGGGVADLTAVGAPARELCALLDSGRVRCRPTVLGGREERTPIEATLPRRAEGFVTGAPCVKLVNGTVACWGADLGRLQDLGLLVLQAFPGSIAPR